MHSAEELDSSFFRFALKLHLQSGVFATRAYEESE